MINNESLKLQRKNMILATMEAKQGHLSSSFSVLEVLNVLYKEIMNFDCKNPNSLENDVCILSKGHAGLALYSLYFSLGIINEEQFFSFSKYESILGEHPDRNKVPGVLVSTGSLGHGLPCGLGLACAFKAQKKNNKVFVIIGDGEANEGSVWESCLAAERLGLNNLVCIVDNNHSESHSPYLVEKFSSFGWETRELDDGNDTEKLFEALKTEHEKPYALILNTKKGFGSELMMKDPEGWHHKVPSEAEYKILMEELS
ncbi:MAG: transketolase [Spirochaetia bacterium]|nr:transketolase [Spirochaetia bacterium]